MNLDDIELLDWIEENRCEIFRGDGFYRNESGERVNLPWRAQAQGTMGPPAASAREAVQALREALCER